MKLLANTVLGALMLAGATALTAAPAAAHVSIGIGIGGGYYSPPSYNYCDRYSRWYDPYRCGGYRGYDNGYYDGYDYYNGPVFIDGYWSNGPFRSRYYGGHRQFFWHDRWHGGSGFHHDGFRHWGGDRWHRH